MINNRKRLSFLYRAMPVFVYILTLLIVVASVSRLGNGANKSTGDGEVEVAGVLSDGTYRFWRSDQPNVVAAMEGEIPGFKNEPKHGGGSEGRFYCSRQQNGYYSIVSRHRWEYLSADENGYICFTKEYTGKKGQQFTFQYCEKDRYHIICADGRAITIKENRLVLKDEADAHDFQIEMIVD